jgi:hypothetical protein
MPAGDVLSYATERLPTFVSLQSVLWEQYRILVFVKWHVENNGCRLSVEFEPGGVGYGVHT